MTPPREELLDVLARFAHGIDTRDWALYRSVFTDDIDVDYQSYRSGTIGTMPAQEWVDRCRRLFPGLDATQHLLANAWVQGNEHEATVRTSMRADHFLAGGRYTLGGWYAHRLVRDDGEWRIRAVTLTVTWQEGDRGLLAVAARRAAGG